MGSPYQIINGKLCAEMLMAIELMADPTRKVSMPEVAKKIGVHRSTIADWKHLPEFQVALAKAVKENILGAAPYALQSMYGLMNSKSTFARYNASKDILDRAGFAAVQVTESRTDVTITHKKLRDLVKDGKESGSSEED